MPTMNNDDDYDDGGGGDDHDNGEGISSSLEQWLQAKISFASRFLTQP